MKALECFAVLAFGEVLRACFHSSAQIHDIKKISWERVPEREGVVSFSVQGRSLNQCGGGEFTMNATATVDELLGHPGVREYTLLDGTLGLRDCHFWDFSVSNGKTRLTLPEVV
jgi:hypothetical protein